jgi:hypothetical protein
MATNRMTKWAWRIGLTTILAAALLAPKAADAAYWWLMLFRVR